MEVDIMIVKDIIKVLEANKNILCHFIEKMTEEEINNRIKDYWTIYEHLVHLTLSKKVILNRIKQFLEEDNPIIKPYFPEDETDNNELKSVKKILEEYCKIINEEIRLIKKANKNVWKKEGKHEEYKKYTFEILILHAIFHDSFHMYRMEQLWIEKEQYIKPLE
jgi:uncharacterized damage-inducible protein DinB